MVTTVTFAGPSLLLLTNKCDTVTNVTLTSAGANPVTVPGIYNIVPGYCGRQGLGNYKYYL